MTGVLLRPDVLPSREFLDFLRDRAVAHVPAGIRDVLDAGAWDGAVLRRLPPGLRVVALDLEPCASGALQVAADLARIPHRDATFDAVLCVNVLVDLHAAAAGPVLSEMARVLRRGGTLVVTAPNRRHPLVRRRASAWKRMHGVEGAYGPGWLAGVLQSTGMTVRRWEWVLPPSRSPRLLVRGLAGIYSALVSIVPSLAPHFLCVAVRR